MFTSYKVRCLFWTFLLAQILAYGQRFTIALNTSDTNIIHQHLEAEDIFLLPSVDNFFYGAFTDKHKAMQYLTHLGTIFPNASVGSFSTMMVPLIWSYAHDVETDDPYHPDFSKFYPDLILFEPSRADLTPEAMRKLDDLAQTLLDFPYLKLILQGHTDPKGNAQMNMQLSKHRAIQVRNYLIKKGIHQDRIQTKALADYAPLEAEYIKNEDGRYDRRVDFIITSSAEFNAGKQVYQIFDLPIKHMDINP